MWKVEPGHKAFKFNKISGVGSTIYREGWHLKAPWFERQIIYDVRTKPREFINKTGTAGKWTALAQSAISESMYLHVVCV